MKESTERSGDGATEGGGRRPERSEPIAPLSRASQRVQVPSFPPFFRDVAKQLRHLAYTQAFRGCESLRLDHFHSGVADKQGTELLTRPMKERYLPPEPLSFGT